MNRKKKKVLYIITKSEPWGGAQKYTYDIATHLPPGFEAVVALGGSGTLKEQLERSEVRTITVEAFQRDINILKEIRALFELFHIVRAERPDVLHVNSSKAGGLGAFVGRVTRVRNIVFTSHGLAFEEDRTWFIQHIILFFTWLTFLLSHHVVLISRANVSRALHMPFIRNKAVLIYNAIDDMVFVSRESARQHLAKIAGMQSSRINDTWVGTVSELHKNKGLTYAIQAMTSVVKKYPDTVFVVISEGEERVTLEKLIKTLGLKNNVYLVGYVTGAASFLMAFDIFTLTSLKEGHPYTLLEAGQAGLPVLGSGIHGIEDIVEDMKTGILVKPKRPDEIAKALEYLIENPQKRKDFGEALKKHIQKTFTQKQMLSETFKVYRTKY